MAINRKGIGGRKPVILHNPFIVKDLWGDSENILWDTEYELDIRIEDTLVGCVRIFSADLKGKKALVNWQKLLRCYRNVHELSAKSIQDYLRCSKATASRYMQVIKFTNPFVERVLQGISGTDIVCYQLVTLNHVIDGYFNLLFDKSK